MREFARAVGRLRGYLRVRQAAATESLRRRLRIASWLAAIWIVLTVIAAVSRLLKLY
jgi:hypothetical protein